jgi:hypothetical protein
VRWLLVGRFSYAEMIWYLKNKTCLLSLAGGLFGNLLAAYIGYPQKYYAEALVQKALQQLMQAGTVFFS